MKCKERINGKKELVMHKMGKNFSISAIRMLAMCSIIACHFCQYYNSEWAWWLNVGVQIFFIISGFLYGNKQIEEPIGWLKKQFKKILVPYYIFLLFVIIVYAVAAPGIIGIKSVILSFFTVGTIKGIEHLWFVSYILFCYLITPYLGILRDYLTKKSFWQTIFILCFVFGTLAIIGILTNGYYRPGRVDCYVLGFYTAVLKKSYGQKVLAWSFLMSVVPCLISNIVYCYFHYTRGIEMVGVLKHVTDYSHMFLGFTITMLLMLILKNIEGNKILQYSDTYSYEIYLVHQLFILSPLTLLTLTNGVVTNVFISIVVILFSGILLKKCNKFVQSNIISVFRW